MRKEVVNLLGGEKAFAKDKNKGKKSRRIAAQLKLSERLYPTGGESADYRVAETAVAYGVAGLAGPAANPFRVAALDVLAGKLEVSADELMIVLGIAGRTAQRRRKEGVLSMEESDRLYRMTRIVEKAIDVLGSEEGAARWLKRPQAFSEGAAPLALLGSDAGAETVEHQLGRIEYGVY